MGEGTLLAAFGLKRMRGEEALLLCGCWSWAPALLVSASVPGPGRGRWLVRIPLSGSGIPGGENAEPRRLVWTSGGGRQVQGLSGRSCPDAAGALGSEPERWETARRWTCLCVRRAGGGCCRDGKRGRLVRLEFDVCNSADYGMSCQTTCFLINRCPLPPFRTEPEKQSKPAISVRMGESCNVQGTLQPVLVSQRSEILQHTQPAPTPPISLPQFLTDMLHKES